MAELNFDASSVQPQSNYEPLPAGDYLCVIEDSEMKPTKAGTGAYLQLTLRVADGIHEGRRIWERLNLKNPNSTAVEIAQKTLSSICHAVGKLQVADSIELHDLPLVLSLKLKHDGQYGLQNEIAAYKPTGNGAAPAAPAPVAPVAAAPAAPAPVAAAPAAAAPPWSKKKTG